MTNKSIRLLVVVCFALFCFLYWPQVFLMLAYGLLLAIMILNVTITLTKETAHGN